ncbi:hypothetical protein FBUS_10756, partial [Fasciolopsis buskii]
SRNRGLSYRVNFLNHNVVISFQCLWKNQSDVYFMDFGCGNGLLVFLLITEGFNGMGVDIRRRRLWDTYPEAVRQNLHRI